MTGKMIGGLLGVIGAAGLAEFLASVYFYRSTMVRSKVKTQRTIKMA